MKENRTAKEYREIRIFWWQPEETPTPVMDAHPEEPAQTYTWEFISADTEIEGREAEWRGGSAGTIDGKALFLRSRAAAGPVWNDITEAQIFLTRKCNLSCGYCKLVDNQCLDELDLQGWKDAGEAMARIGIKTVKILGGEPTVRDWLPELVTWYQNLGIRVALLSNSLFDEEMEERLVSSGLFGYFASVDSLADIHHYDTHTGEKSRSGYAMLKRLQAKGIPLVAANAVIQRQNIHDIPELVQRLSDEGIYINLCTIQHTRDKSREFSRADVNQGNRRFREEDRQLLRESAATLTDMRRRGVKIAVPASYLENMEHYAPDCSWRCERLSQLRIDADGGMMLCNEYRTPLADSFNIVGLARDQWAEYQQIWIGERESTECQGCYWSCFLQAEENIRLGIGEFSYTRSVCEKV